MADALSVTNTTGADSSPGVSGQSGSGDGVFGSSDSGNGVYGQSGTGSGVSGFCSTGTGVYGQSQSGIGVHAVGGGATASGGVVAAIVADGGPNPGVYATSATSSGFPAVTGFGTNGAGGIGGGSDSGNGVVGQSGSGSGVFGISNSGVGVEGICDSNDAGVFGQSGSGPGISATSGSGPAGVFNALSATAAVVVNGNLDVSGTIDKGGGGFKVDHPLDAANKYLYHSFVESSERKNVYDGVVTLDSTGRIEVELPAWFEALNRDFRYQLTPIGAPAPDLHIARKVADGRFAIAGGQSGLEVSWQVTGVRKDAWAQANPLEVEKEKPLNGQGFYVHPELHGEPTEKGMVWAQYPGIMRRMQNKSKTLEFKRLPPIS